MKQPILSAFAAFSLFGATAQTTGVTWSTPVDVNAVGQGALRPRIAVNGDGNPVVLWGDLAPNSNHVAVGNGAGFNAPVEVSMPGCVPAVADWMGSSIASIGNTVWVVMKATPEESKPLYVRRSDDGGSTWGDTLRVEPYDGLVSRFPSIAAVVADEPLVQYMQFDSGYFGARQVVAHALSGSFMPPVQVSAPFAPGDVCDCCPNQIVLDGTKAVALYRNAGPNIRVMWGAASTDGGATFPTGAVVDNTAWNLGACPSSGPDGYLFGDSIRYVWMSGANNGNKVYMGTASADDLSLGNQTNVHPGQMSMLQQNFPRIAGSGDTLGVVWQQLHSGQYEILFSWSVTGPSGLSAPDTVNVDLAGAQKTPDIAFADGAFHVVWGEFATGQVRYRKATLSSNVALEEPRAVEAVDAWPNPVHDVLHVGPNAWSAAEISDEQGKVLQRLPVRSGNVDLSGLPAGSYAVRLIGTSGGTAVLRIAKY